MSITLEIPGKIVQGAGALAELPEIIAERGFRQVSVIMDPGVGRTEYVKMVLRKLQESGIKLCVNMEIKSEPTFSILKQLYAETELMQAELFLAIGGGSVMDATKLLAVMANNPEFAAWNGDSEHIRQPGTPFFAVPTTAGTGAEATPNAILFDEEKQKKTGIVSRRMIADAVILDGNLTKSLPGYLAAVTGFDALAHALESFTSKKANVYSDMYAAEAMRLIFHNIIPACVENDDEARQNMLLASFYAGTCLVTSSTHLIHAMAYPLAEQYHMSHGEGIAVLLAAGVRCLGDYRSEQIVERCLPKKYRACSPGDLYKVIDEYREILHIEKRLSDFGICEASCHGMAAAARENRRLFNNCPVSYQTGTLVQIYQSLL